MEYDDGGQAAGQTHSELREKNKQKRSMRKQNSCHNINECTLFNNGFSEPDDKDKSKVKNTKHRHTKTFSTSLEWLQHIDLSSFNEPLKTTKKIVGHHLKS